MTPLDNRIALVTGAGSGIGAATALLLARQGAHVCCADVDLVAAEATARDAVGQGFRASSHALDVREEPQWESVLEQAHREPGPISILVNCAGISAASPLSETPLAEWRRVFATNLDGVELMVDGGFVL